MSHLNCLSNPKWLKLKRNQEPMEIFSELTAEPVAAASLGQARCVSAKGDCCLS